MKFEDLEAWQVARLQVREIYELCRLPGLGNDFGLRDQIQRAAVSVMTNIAEGFDRSGKREKLHFYNIARASNSELRSLLYVVGDVYPQLKEKVISMQESCNRAGQILSGLIRSTR